MAPSDDPPRPGSSNPDSANPASTTNVHELSSKLSSSPNPPDDTTIDTKSSTASSRLNQLSSHLSSSPNPPDSLSSTPAASPNTSKPRARKSRSKSRPTNQISALPPDYADILQQIADLKTIAANPDRTTRGYIRQKQSGKLHVRERIAALLDPNSFREIGSSTGTIEWRTSSTNPQAETPVSFIPSNNPNGYGTLTCPRTGQKREILLTADDFSIRAGHADGATMAKTLFVEQMCLKLKIPIVKLVDGSSGGGSVTTIKKNGYAYMPLNLILKPVVEQLNMGIPNLGAVVGSAIGLGAARVVSTHFSVMAADIGSLFNAGPAVVAGATFEEGLSFSDLGGPAMHCTNGTIDNMAQDEEGCFEQIRTVLGYLPNCGAYEAPPVVKCTDPVDREDIGLRTVVPRKKNRMYNPWTIITSVVDKGSWFEIGSMWGRTGITGLARLGGRPVGVISLNCEVNGGALDTAGSQKLTRLIKLCDVMNLPILQFLDIPGYAIGTVAERSATMRWGVQLAMAYYSTTTPIFSVITRRVYGVAGGLMLDSREPIMRVAWPSGNWGSLPLDGGIEVGHRQELKEAEQAGKKAERYKELEDEYLRLMNPVRTANAFLIEDIIDPKDTRSVCCSWAKQMYGLLMQERLADRLRRKINPVYT